MKQVALATYNTITSDHANVVGTVAHAEWYMNKFYKTLVDNTPSEDTDGYDIEMFPIESIVKPYRPLAGICKAMVGLATVAPNYHTEVPSARFYTVDPDDEYKYWQSPYPSATNGVLTNCAPQVLYVQDNGVTEQVVNVNKVHLTVENTQSWPVEYDIYIKTAGAWSLIADEVSAPIQQGGKIELWWTGTAWTNVKTVTAPGGPSKAITGVKLIVNKMYVPASSRTVNVSTTAGSNVVRAQYQSVSMDDVSSTVTGANIPAGAVVQSVRNYSVTTKNYATGSDGRQVEIAPTVNYYADLRLNVMASSTTSSTTITVAGPPTGVYFNLIELGAALERDLTADLESWSDSFSMGETDFITPLGQISANTGNITLFNNDAMTYHNDNPASEFYGLLDKGVIIRVWMQYGSDLVKEMEMISESWEAGEADTQVNLTDYSKVFMDTKVRPVLYQNMPVQEVVWRICDIIGWSKYNVTALSTAQQATIDIFWSEKDKTAWEILQDLSKATQTAIYIDSYGVLQVKTRDAAWDNTKPAAYYFDRLDNTNAPANIASVDESSDYEANKVTVNYKPTGFSELVDNVVPMEVVWEPSGTTVLRATPLARNLLAGGTVIYLEATEGRTWPFKGLMNIQGEIIRYEGKQYIYYNNGVRTSAWVYDLDQQKKLDALSGSFYKHLNQYNGVLKVTQRGEWNTVERSHYIDMNGWSKTRRKNHTSNNTPCSGITLHPGQSTVTVQGVAGATMEDFTYLHTGNATDDGYYYLGFRMKIDNTAHKHKTAGFMFCGDAFGAGYYIDVMATARMNGKMRNTRNEVMLYSQKAGGQRQAFGGEKVTMKDKSKPHKKNAKIKKDVGAKVSVPMGTWIDFDIWYTPGTNDYIQVYINGKLTFDTTITGASGWKHGKVSRMGVYARGHSAATFEYVYGINSPGAQMVDSEQYYDRINGGYYSTQASDWTFATRDVRRRIKKKWTKIKNQKYAQQLFEEFGPICHEIREYDVKYTPDLPVLESKIYMSNTSQAVCTEFTGDVSGAKFVLANISRQDATISGDDNVTTAGNGSINHKIFVYGRPVIQKDSAQITKQDDWSISRRGLIEVEYDSKWIQNEAEANRFADWLTTKWTRSDSTLSVDVFGNPMIELTDVVNVNWRHINGLFYVTAIDNSWDNGLSTRLTLRKVT